MFLNMSKRIATFVMVSVPNDRVATARSSRGREHDLSMTSRRSEGLKIPTAEVAIDLPGSPSLLATFRSADPSADKVVVRRSLFFAGTLRSGSVKSCVLRCLAQARISSAFHSMSERMLPWPARSFFRLRHIRQRGNERRGQGSRRKGSEKCRGMDRAQFDVDLSRSVSD